MKNLIKQYEFALLVGLTAVVSLFTFAMTEDRVNWLLDAGWVVVGVPLLVVSRRWFELTPLLYRLLVLHALVLIAGGYWTYEEMPVGLWLKNVMGTERNHYDRFGHFMQGFVPAIIFREIFVRCSPVRRGPWLVYFVLTSCLAFSAFFELLEWRATVMSGDNADAFLGHQGDIWDAQWDMAWAAIGAMLSLATLSHWHNRNLAALGIPC